MSLWWYFLLLSLLSPAWKILNGIIYRGWFVQLNISGQTVVKYAAACHNRRPRVWDVWLRVLISISCLKVLKHEATYLKCVITSFKHVAAYFSPAIFKDEMKLVAECLKYIGQYFVTYDKKLYNLIFKIENFVKLKQINQWLVRQFWRLIS